MSTCASSPRSPSKVSISNPTRRRPSPRISLVRNPLRATPSWRSRSARRPRTVVFPAPGRASIRRRAGTDELVPELLPLLALAQSGPFRDRQEGHGYAQGGHEADEVQLEDVPGADQVGDRPADHGAGEPEPERPQQADLLLAGQQQPCQKADDEPGDDESDHDSLIPRGGGWDTRLVVAAAARVVARAGISARPAPAATAAPPASLAGRVAVDLGHGCLGRVRLGRRRLVELVGGLFALLGELLAPFGTGPPPLRGRPALGPVAARGGGPRRQLPSRAQRLGP